MAEIGALIETRVVGRAVRELGVYGINALKSLPATVATLTGQRVTSAETRDDRTLVIVFDSARLVVDLQRTGTVEWLAAADGWHVASGPMPTGRLLLDDGSAVDFKEPAKTKRITFRVS